MKQIEITQNSQRLGQEDLTFDDLQQSVPHRPSCRNKLYMVFFLGVTLLIVWSIHYGSSKYKLSSSPFVQEVKEYKQKQLIQIPHDDQCYTQGLSFINKTHILESCGLYQNSYFHILEYKQLDEQTAVTIEVFRSKNFDKKYFLQGSVHFPVNDMIYFLTWQEKVVFRYDTDTLQQVDMLTWGREGWGLTHNNTHLIVSDGSDEIYITNEKMEILEKIKVKDHMGVPKERLNELEWIQQGNKQFVLANVYTTSEIVKIDLSTGQIAQTFDFKGLTLKQAKKKHLEFFNGIAFNKEAKNYLLTGKKWDSMYQMIHL